MFIYSESDLHGPTSYPSVGIMLGASTVVLWIKLYATSQLEVRHGDANAFGGCLLSLQNTADLRWWSATGQAQKQQTVRCILCYSLSILSLLPAIVVMSSSIVFANILSAISAIWHYVRSIFAFARSTDVDIETGPQARNAPPGRARNVIPSVSQITARSDSSSFHCEDLGFIAVMHPYRGMLASNAQVPICDEGHPLQRTAQSVQNLPSLVSGNSQLAPTARTSQPVRSHSNVAVQGEPHLSRPYYFVFLCLTNSKHWKQRRTSRPSHKSQSFPGGKAENSSVHCATD